MNINIIKEKTKSKTIMYIYIYIYIYMIYYIDHIYISYTHTPFSICS